MLCSGVVVLLFFPFIKSYFILFVFICFYLFYFSLFFPISIIAPCDWTPSSHRRDIVFLAEGFD